MKWVWNIPNVLSIIRLALVPVIAITYLMSDTYPELLFWAAAALITSGVTDVLDGIIARKCNQITEIGKILDPAADKLTQLTVLVCLTIRHLNLLPIMALCLVKEVCQTIGGFLLIEHGEKMRQSKWFGKLSTVIFYVATGAIVAFPNMPRWLYICAVCVMGAAMLFAFVRYFAIFMQLSKAKNAELKEENERN